MLAVLLFSSCTKNFEPKIYGSLIPENFPSTQAEYESYTMTCYTPFTTTWVYNIGSGGNQHGFYIPEGGVLRMFEATTDAMAPWTIGGWDQWLQLSKANFTDCVYYWRGGVGENNPNHFQKLAEVTRFTQIIGTLEAAPDDIFSDNKKQQLLGEAHLCRGLMLYYLLHIYGPLPAVLDPAQVLDDETLQDMERPTLDEMTAWISADLEYAVANMAEQTAEKGRYTADYARFCLMRHYINEGQHTAGYYQKAIDLYQVLQGKGYSLYTAGTNPYVDQFKNANKFNQEVIMAVSCDPSADGSTKSGNFNPLSWLALPWDVSKVDSQGKPTPFYLQGGGWNQYYNVSPQFYAGYEANDQRKDVILTSYWVNNNGQPATWQRTSADIGVSWNGYIINKFPIETATPFQGTDIPLARWADVLLLYAEATVRQSGSAPDAAAIQAVNEVRHRAGLGDLSSAKTATAEAFLNALLDERGHELLYEGCRKIDLIRFNQYAQRTAKSKGLIPTHQYMPLPNYAVDQAATYGKHLAQTYERPEWKQDLAAASAH